MKIEFFVFLIASVNCRACDESLSEWPFLRRECRCLKFNDTKYTNRSSFVDSVRPEGVIGVRLPVVLPAGNYRVKLVHEDRGKHSEIDLEVKSSGCGRCEEYEKPITFDHVFKGYYKLAVTTEGTIRRKIWECKKTHIETSYTKRALDEPFLDILSPKRVSTNETKLTILIRSDYFTRQPDLQLLLYNGQVTLKGIQQTDKFLVCSNRSWSCKYEKGKDKNGNFVHSCKLTNINTGDYSYDISILNEDTRCNVDSLWVSEPPSHCRYISDLKIMGSEMDSSLVDTEDSPVDTEDIVSEDRSEIYVITLMLLLLALVIFLALFFTYKKFREHKHRSSCKIPASYPDATPLVAPIKNCSVEILLVYSRDCEEFEGMIKSLVILIHSIEKNALIHDLNYPSEDMMRDPMQWLRSKLADKKVIVLFIVNQCGLLIYEDKTISYKNPKFQDPFFRHAVDELVRLQERNYKNLHVIETLWKNDRSPFDIINPGVRYYPNSIELLLRTIFVENDEIVYKTQLNRFFEYTCAYIQLCRNYPDYINDIVQKNDSSEEIL